jgi:hypothetical protein
MSITNRDEANQYFDKVNKLVDDYMMNGKIRPSMLKRYLKPGGENFNFFLKMNDLTEVNGIDRVLADVIEDRAGMERDGVMTFESFKVFESDEFRVSSMRQCLYKGIEAAGIDAEKAVADCFDTNLGHVNVESSEAHVFSVEGWEGEEVKVIAYSKEEILLIYENMVDFLYGEACKKTLDLPGGISLSMEGLIEETSFRRNLDIEMGAVSETEGIGDGVVKTIEELTGTNFKEITGGHFIFVSAN